MPTRIRSASLVAALTGAGCGSYTTYQTAEPLPLHRWQLAIGSTSGEFFDLPQQTQTPTLDVELASRYGIGHDTDVGLKLYTLGAEASVRHRFIAGKWQWAGLAALGGARTTRTFGSTEAVTGHVRVGAVTTRRLSTGLAVSFGPLVTASLFVPAGGGSSYGVLIGAFANTEFSLGEDKRWHLVPEISLHVSALGDVPVSGAVALGGLAISRDF